MDKGPFQWNVGYNFCFLGYIMLGYVIRKWAEQRKSNRSGIIIIAMGIAVELIIVYLKYEQLKEGINNDLYTMPFSPILAISSVLIFTGISLVNVSCTFGNLPRMSLYIYLFHAGVLRLVRIILEKIWSGKVGSACFIIVCSVIVFAISYILSIVYEKGRRIVKRKTLCAFMKGE